MEYIILGLLILSNRTIYQLRSRIDKGLNVMYSSSMGSIQAAIKKLMKNEYIDFREVYENGKKKKEYFITELGKQVFNNWVNRPVDAVGFKCPELSKLYFMGFSERKTRLDNILKYICELKNKFELLKLICDESEIFIQSAEYGQLDAKAKDIVFYQLASARFGRDILLFTINWYEELLCKMRENNE